MYIEFLYLYVHSCFMYLFTSDLPVDMCPSRRGKKSFTSLLLSSSSFYVVSTDNNGSCDVKSLGRSNLNIQTVWLLTQLFCMLLNVDKVGGAQDSCRL